jgi:hypothetical protein
VKQVTPFYTVITVASGRFTVRYVTPPDWTVQEIGVNYDDPAEARRQFKKFERFQIHSQVEKKVFDKRILCHKQDMEKLKQWTHNEKHVSCSSVEHS